MYELAWAAGFYEGEGTFFCRTSRGRSKLAVPNGLVLAAVQRNEEPLLKFHGVFGQGHIYQRIRGGKLMWHFSITRTQDSLAVAEQLWPWLSERRQDQIISAIDEFLSVPHVKYFDVGFFSNTQKEVSP